ncbi:MAG: YgiQ family radical SAM protein, partial [Negativicutes bacterium]|nr:YgiQ family radical SAM protein [Negativicutes bacterium]
MKTFADNDRLTEFLPATRPEMTARGWAELDFLLVSGDAYVDHPSFGTALVGRWLESLGYRVGVVAQPDWRRLDDFRRLGRPRLAALVTAGNLDSMLANYTAARRRRLSDQYSPGGQTGRRPDRATVVYCRCLRRAFPGCKLIVGGIEASLRRFVHYDYWQDRVLPSILRDCGADLLIYGMAEKPLAEVAERLAAGRQLTALPAIGGTCQLLTAGQLAQAGDYRSIAGWDEICADRKKFAVAWREQEEEQNPFDGRPVVQGQGDGQYLYQAPPARPLTTAEMDELYRLPFQRRWHFIYDQDGGVPALAEVRFSITSQRGCFGGCSFCALTFHQGRIVQS